jgi:hypothetical protein
MLSVTSHATSSSTLHAGYHSHAVTQCTTTEASDASSSPYGCHDRRARNYSDRAGRRSASRPKRRIRVHKTVHAILVPRRRDEIAYTLRGTAGHLANFNSGENSGDVELFPLRGLSE